MSVCLDEIVRNVKAGRDQPTLRVKDFIKQIKDSRNLNIFTEVLEEQALKQAALIEKKISDNQSLGRLAGVVFAVKDNFLCQETITTAAAPFLKDFIAPYTGTCLQKLLDEDAILIGKTNLDAFAHGTSTENSFFGATKNPLNPSLSPGGSSGGSAAAVAAETCDFALGTDTGGSVRLPASFCGIFGFKPTYGLLSRYGVVAMASSTDCVAPLTKSPADSLLLINLLKGSDDLDGTTFDSSSLKDLDKSLPALKMGFIKELRDNLDPEVGRALDEVLDLVRQSGFELIEISLPSIHLALACYYVLVSAEISSNLSRYSGLHYGGKSSCSSWDETVSTSRGDGFMAENKRRIMLGTYVLSHGYYEAYYKKAQQLRTLIIKEFEQAFEKVDALLSPVCSTLPFSLGSRINDPLQMYLADLMTVAPSLVGIPASSLPVGNKQAPVGIQIMTRAKEDYLNLRIAKEISALRS